MMENRRKHILVISQYFYPESFRINDMCKEWVKRGYKVTVLTGIPNYPQGQFFEGYSYIKKRKEKWHDINIIRIPLIRRGKTSIGLIVNYLSFVVSGFFWAHFTKIKADFVFTFEVSPMTQALIGVWYTKKYKIPNYLYVQDLWPENVEIITGIKSKFIIEPIKKMVNYIYKYNDIIFATSPSYVRKIQKSTNNKVVYLPQYAEEFYQPLDNDCIIDDISDNDYFNIVFTGNVGAAQGLDILPKAAKILKERNEYKVHFVIIGDGRCKEKLIKETIKLNVNEMFVFGGQKKPEQIPQYLAVCDVAFLSLLDSELSNSTIPAKLQSYMACAMPILAVAKGETKRIIEDASCGWVCESNSIDELVNTIIKIKSSSDLAEKSNNSRMYYVNNFSKNKVMNIIDDLIKNI